MDNALRRFLSLYSQNQSLFNFSFLIISGRLSFHFSIAIFNRFACFFKIKYLTFFIVITVWSSFISFYCTYLVSFFFKSLRWFYYCLISVKMFSRWLLKLSASWFFFLKKSFHFQVDLVLNNCYNFQIDFTFHTFLYKKNVFNKTSLKNPKTLRKC